jgi:prevent-host-death family protein
MKKIALSQAKDDLSRVLRDAQKQAVVITRHGKPAGVLVGFADDDDWLEYRLLNDPRFARRIADARRRLVAGKGVAMERIPLPGFRR